MVCEKQNRDWIAEICALIETMNSLAAPPPLTLPSPPNLASNSAQLAIDSAKSATAIAEATARLGVSGDDQTQAEIIWNETLNQMERIQNLYNLPPYPFQGKALPSANS